MLAAALFGNNGNTEKKMAGIAQLNKLFAPVVEGMGFEFVGLEYLSGSSPAILRFYIDHEQGITVDNCAAVSRQISSVLDVEDPITGEYTLEVSSPGMDRPLFIAEHYQQFLGERIKCKLRMPQDGRRNFTGKLLEANEEKIVLSIDNDEFELFIDDIEKANIVPR